MDVSSSDRTGSHRATLSSRSRSWQTLIVFLHSSSPARQRSKRASDNLRYFIDHGLECAYCTFSILLEGQDFATTLPARANVLVHSIFNVSGYEFSHYKAFFSSPQLYPGCPTIHDGCRTDRSNGLVEIRQDDYSKFILLSDSMRGPYLPPYEPLSRWPALITARLSEQVKLVGGSINCFNCGRDIRSCERLLHTEGGITVTDSVGLQILLSHWKQVRPGDKWDEISHNEVGGPVAIRKAGFNIAALQHFWRGHNFRDLPLTQRKCALLLNRSKTLFPRADLPIEPREVDADGKEHVTTLHSGYVDIGGISCKGCYWGMDHPPLESIFTHHFVSPAFEHGAARVYSEMDAEIHKLEHPRGMGGGERVARLALLNGAVELTLFTPSPLPPPPLPPPPPTLRSKVFHCETSSQSSKCSTYRGPKGLSTRDPVDLNARKIGPHDLKLLH